MDRKGNIVLIDCESVDTVVMLVEGNSLSEIYLEKKEAQALSGNIYNGRVVNVLNGLQSAFVDIGNGEVGYWEISNVLAHKSMLKMSSALPNNGIIAKAGDHVMVQVTKERNSKKAPKLTSNVSIPGHYLVYLYNIDFVSVSNKITDENVRSGLVELLSELAPKGRGFIARTSCNGADYNAIRKEAKQLIMLGNKLQSSWEATTSSVASLIYSEGDIFYRTIREMLHEKIDAIYCNDAEITKQIAQNARTYCGFYNGRIEYYNKDIDMLEYFGVRDDFYSMNNKSIPLLNGGSLVIEKTEALTAIDVNTGSFSCECANHEECVYQNNLVAVKEIVRQLRLRNIGGIIIIDFVDMQDEWHRKSIVNELQVELRLKDKGKTKVCEMSELGLVQMTRMRTGKDFTTISEQKCPFCGGNGEIEKTNYLIRKLKIDIKKLLYNDANKRVALHVNPHYFNDVISSKMFDELKLYYNDRNIYAISDWSLKINEYYAIALEDWETVPRGTVTIV